MPRRRNEDSGHSDYNPTEFLDRLKHGQETTTSRDAVIFVLYFRITPRCRITTPACRQAGLHHNSLYKTKIPSIALEIYIKLGV